MTANAILQSLPSIMLITAIVSIILVLAEKLMSIEKLDRRMKNILSERARIRNRERHGLVGQANKNRALTILNYIVKQAQLAVWLLDDETQKKLLRAGYRSTTNRTIFLSARLFSMLGGAALIVFYSLLSGDSQYLFAIPLAVWLGFRMSVYSLDKIAAKRDQEMSDSASDIIDLLTVCVESGMSVEVALQRVAEEMASQSVVVGDELAITAAELSYVPKRSDAFANLIARTGSKPIQDLCISLIQADSFGTSIAATLRLQSAEARKLRRLDAERRALSIPPKLSVVMVFFFLPVIFIVMLYPTLSKMSEMKMGL